MKDEKLSVRIAAVDFGSEKFMLGMVLKLAEYRYTFEITTDRDADYVFHSNSGHDVLKYSGVRIFITGENVTPNFAVSDYAMAFDQLTFGDRYIWLPLIRLYHEAYPVLTAPRPSVDEIFRNKTDFCAYVMSNTTNSAEERIRIFDLLSAYKPVNSGGRWRNNVGGRVADKLAFQSKHKFVIAFENCSHPGYLTEKFAEAAAANAVPVYWGDPTIGKLFNAKAFINCHDFQTLEEAVEQVKRIDQDDNLYRQMLAEPWFPGGIEPECLRDKAFADFLSNIFDQDPKTAFRRNRGRWGLKNEQNLYDMCHRPYIHGYKLFRKGWRNFCHTFLPRRKMH
ncbi:MAG: glycosyltransferase [Kiritimatiellaceae bacterium]|nr:glycosyltransferase [Kiritimatiellaceae bacterium]